MSKPLRYLRVTLAPLAGLVLAGTAATQLTGCVIRAGYAEPPPPPPAYEPPPPQPAPAEAPPPEADAQVQASEPPPPLPDYEQPPCPVAGYIWTPGYWAYAPVGYYWVPGTWVAPPRVGLLWTPGYWGAVGGVYMFHAGYWGPHVGFYGGVNYGFGYTGAGFAGGRWVGGTFAYNRAVTNVNVTVVHNTYNETVVNNVTVNRVSYNGGAGGIARMPSREESLAAHEQHLTSTSLQREHVQQAAANPQLLARNNGGRPAIAATPRPAAFNAPGAVGAHGTALPPPHAVGQANGKPPQAPAYGRQQSPAALGGKEPPAAFGGAQPPPAYGKAGHQASPQAPAPAQAHSQAPAPKPNAAKPQQHPKNPPEKGKRDAETAQR